MGLCVIVTLRPSSGPFDKSTRQALSELKLITLINPLDGKQVLPVQWRLTSSISDWSVGMGSRTRETSDDDLRCEHCHGPGCGGCLRSHHRRKNHNVAVVATARKLAVIAWRILTAGEPYRYAQRAAAAKKLPSLRIAAGGEKRQGAARAV